jgi:streptogramin lyase
MRWTAIALGALLPLAAGAGSPPRLKAQLVTGLHPCGAVAALGSVWVANYDAGTLARIDPARNRVVRRIGLGRGICPVAFDAGALWVGNDRADTVLRVDPGRGRVLARLRIPHWPAHFAVGAGSVWISSYESGRVLRLDRRTGRVVRTYRVGGNPSGLALVARQLWVAFGRGTALGRVDLASGTVVRFPLGHRAPGFLAAIGGDLWTSTGDGHVLRVDPRTGRVNASFAVPGTPAEVAAGPDDLVWVAEKERNTLTRIDPDANRIVDVTPAGPGALSVVAAAGDVWVTSFAGNDVRRFAAGG